jgi:hypothetical protein
MATTYYNDLQKLYVAYFNRPGDTTGLANYETQLEAAGTDAKAIAAVMARISAEFSNSTEYKANFTGKTNAEIVDTVYMNLFGRPADEGGKKFYADNITAGKLSVAAVVTEVAKGAQGSDLVAYNNKVTAAAAFSAALKSTDSYNTQAAATAAKAFLSNVTDNASLATAIDPVQLQVSIAKVNAAAQPFSLETGLAAVTAADTIHTNFLDAFDGKVDGKVTKADADVTGAVTTAQAAIATKVDAALHAAAVAAGATSNPEEGLYGNANTSAAIKAAVLAEAQADLNAKLTADTKALSDTNAAIAKVAGLSDALAALAAANAAVDTTTAAQKAAGVDLGAKVGAYNAQNTTAVTVAADGTVTGLITADSKGKLSLATGVTETTNPGVTALLASSVAKEAADLAVTNANTAQGAAQTAYSSLDLTDAAKADLKSIAAAMTVVKLDAGATPSQAQIATEVSGLSAIYNTNKAISDKMASTDAGYAAAVKATTDAKTALDAFNGLVTKFTTDDNADPLFAAQTAQTAAIKTDNDNITALNKAVADLATANTAASQLAAINAQVKAAGDAFVTNKLMTPITLDATHTAPLATAGADIYVAKTTDANITNFGLLGSDALYLGSKYTLGADITKGNDAAIEAFIVKNTTSGFVEIKLEQKAFASSEVTPGADMVTITLTGVTDVTKVHLNNGIITVS